MFLLERPVNAVPILLVPDTKKLSS